jgi:hypothetical protein
VAPESLGIRAAVRVGSDARPKRRASGRGASDAPRANRAGNPEGAGQFRRARRSEDGCQWRRRDEMNYVQDVLFGFNSNFHFPMYVNGLAGRPFQFNEDRNREKRSGEKILRQLNVPVQTAFTSKSWESTARSLVRFGYCSFP